MPIDAKSIVVGATFTSKRWKGDRQVTRRYAWRDVLKGKATLKEDIHFIDLRTGRTGTSPIKVFAAVADGPGLMTVPK